MSLLNPFANELFLQVIIRGIWIFALGFVLIVILNKFKIQGIWKTEVGKRYLSWLVIAPLYMFCIASGPITTVGLLVLVLLLSFREINMVTKLPALYIYILIFLAVLSLYVVFFQATALYVLPIIYFLVITVTAIFENNAKKGFLQASLTMFISMWLIFTLIHFVLLSRFNQRLDGSLSLLMFLGVAIPLSDVMAYVIGRSFSKVKALDQYKVASNLSPKKSFAGILGNIAGIGLGVGVMYFAIGGYLSIYQWVLVSILLGIAGITGDIAASMFKRFYGVKDSGTLIPGHGGILDRIDSSIVIIVAFYYCLLLIIK